MDIAQPLNPSFMVEHNQLFAIAMSCNNVWGTTPVGICDSQFTQGCNKVWTAGGKEFSSIGAADCFYFASIELASWERTGTTPSASTM